jgi:hypothetical protein
MIYWFALFGLLVLLIAAIVVYNLIIIYIGLKIFVKPIDKSE